MTAKKGNRKEAPSKKVPKDVEEEAIQIEETEQVVAAAKDDGTRQAREKAKGKKQGAFVSFFKKADPIALTCFVAILLASCVVIGAYVNDHYFSSGGSAMAQEGSTVEVEYVGSYLGYYDVDGAVIFDTNIKDVAEKDSYIFSSAFTERTTYNNLSFKIGGTGVIKAFGDACVGYKSGDVVKVVVPASDDAYGTADRLSAASKTVTINLAGVTTLEKFNELCGTTYTAATLSTPQTVSSPIEGIDFVAQYDVGTKKVNYTFVGVTDGTYSLKAGGASVAVSNVTATQFDMTLNVTSNGVLKSFMVIDGELTPIFVEYTGGAGFTYWVNDLSEHAEPKGETMYFVIKIKSVTN